MSVPEHERYGAAPHLQRGRYGEDLAARWYLDRGYAVVARNWRGSGGEVDLLLARPGLLVVCEVKARLDERFGSPLEAITWAKQRRLRRLAAEFLATSWDGGEVEVRFDAAGVRSGQIEVVHGAW